MRGGDGRPVGAKLVEGRPDGGAPATPVAASGFTPVLEGGCCTTRCIVVVLRAFDAAEKAAHISTIDG